MHPNPAFRSTTSEENLAFARQRGFGILSVNGDEGPLAAHVPFLLSPDATTADLHLARSNPIVRAVAAHGADLPALMAVPGPDAYISPDWYGIPDQVPTWNYIAVHLRGTLSALPEDDLRSHVDEISAEHEHRLPKKPWHSSKMAEGVMPRMMRMIVPFRLTIRRVDGTWKLNQNKTEEARLSAISGLLAQPDPMAHQIAALMQADVQARRKPDDTIP